MLYKETGLTSRASSPRDQIGNEQKLNDIRRSRKKPTTPKHWLNNKVAIRDGNCVLNNINNGVDTWRHSD